MKINVNEASNRLGYEDGQLVSAMNSTSELLPCMEEFMYNDGLYSNSYNKAKKVFSAVNIPLVQGTLCMLESKYEGNTTYKNALNTYLAGMGIIDLDKLQSGVDNMTNQIATLESNKVLGVVAEPYKFVLDKIIAKTKEKIEKVKAFIAATNGCYDDFNQKYAIVVQGIASGQTVSYTPGTGIQVGFDNYNMEWARQAAELYNNKTKAIIEEQYGDYLKANPNELMKVKVVVNYERFHPNDAQKVNNFLGCLEQQDIIGIKNVAYTADPVYRELWIRYLDRYKIEQTSGSGAYFSPSEDKIVVNVAEYRNERYHTFFHECGHAIDTYAGLDAGKKDKYSNGYATDDGKVFESTIRTDVENTTLDYIDRILAQGGYDINDPAVQTARTNVLMSIMSGGTIGLTEFEQNVSDSVSEEFAEKAIGRRNSLASDVYSGVTNFELVGNYSHAFSEDRYGNYWYYNNGKVRRNPSSEYVAEYYGYVMSGNEEGIWSVKKYLPESKEIMDQMVQDIYNQK